MFRRTIATVACCLLFIAAAFAQGVLPQDGLEPMLRAHQCDPGDLDSVLAAAKDGPWPTRWLACQFLSYRPGDKSVAALKERLDDPELRVRAAAAESLLVLGDRSGIEQVRKDWRSLVSEQAERDPTRMRELNLYNCVLALEIGRILARAGGGRALPLAAFAAGDETIARRKAAVDVLAQGLLLDASETGKWGVDCLATLERIAAGNGDFLVAAALVARMEKAPAHQAVAVLEKLSASPRLADLPRKAARDLLARKQAEARGKPAATQPASSRPVIVNDRRKP